MPTTLTDDILSDLTIVARSPNIVYLLKWASSTLDFTKVSSQTDLTRWLQDTIKEEIERLGIDERDYKKRFKGMIKFFTHPDLGLKTAEEIQTILAEDIVDELSTAYNQLRDYEDVLTIISDYKDVQLPPLTPNQLRSAFRSIMSKLYDIRSKVRSHKDYPELLLGIKQLNQIIKSGRHKELPNRLLRRHFFRARHLLDLSEKIRKDLKLPITILRPTIEKIVNTLREEIVRRAVR